jgi:hypothetical protein
MPQGSKEINEILKAIDDGLVTFDEAIPGIQQQIYTRLLRFEKELSIQGDTITNSVKNIKLLGDLKADLEKIILDSSDYTDSVEKFGKLYDSVTKLNYNYYKALENKFKPPKMIDEIRKQSVNVVLEGLTESGLNANVITPVREIINTYVTTGGSYTKLAKELDNYINGYQSDAGQIDGALQKYTKQITTDAIHQYNATVNKAISSDLGYEWFRYVGSNIKTTRTFCKALTEKQYYHISELPDIIKGDFEQFKAMKGKIYDKTGLPEGMYDDTNTSNFDVYRGGYNCGHQAYPIPTALVPKTIINQLNK